MWTAMIVASYDVTSGPSCIPIRQDAHVIETVFVDERVWEKHRLAPLLPEREQYLKYLSEIGTRRERIRNIATMLLHVVRLLKLESLHPVGPEEIELGCGRWICDPEARRHRRPGAASQYHFHLVATNWLRFQGALLERTCAEPLFGNILAEFLDDMRSQRGSATATLDSYRKQMTTFLRWLHARHKEFANVRASDIEGYIEAKREWSPNSVAAHCRTLRTFFGYAEKRGWCSYGLRGTIRGVRVPRIAENLIGPPWEDVRRAIAAIGDTKPADLRAKAMFLLFSIYGLRSAEVRSLVLDDIDWLKESLTVRRAKRGKTQQFPLQHEVGEAIAVYLERARPRCACRALFVTLNPPYRPVSGQSMSPIVNPRMKRAGMLLQQYGPHMLRRACATELLRTGSSLKDIADFLGHSDLRSVGSYAKFDSGSLRDVAKFSLRGVL